MKLSNLLLEMSEKLNRSVYGEWITPQGRVLQIEDDKEHHHQWFARNVLGREPMSGEIERIQHFAANRGWIRVAHPPGQGRLFIDGYREGIERAANIIAPTLGQDDMELVIIHKVDEKDVGEFYLPQDRIAALKFLRGES